VCVWQTSVVVVVVRVSESGELHQPSTIIDQGPSASREEFWLAGAALVRLWSAHVLVGRRQVVRLWAAGVVTGSAALDRGNILLHRVLSVAPLPSPAGFCRSTSSLFRESAIEPRQLIGSLAATCSSHSGHRTARIGSLPTRQKVLTAATWDVFWRRQD
jgi:hypothetical protein